jgi:hypothetical protein
MTAFMSIPSPELCDLCLDSLNCNPRITTLSVGRMSKFSFWYGIARFFSTNMTIGTFAAKGPGKAWAASSGLPEDLRRIR